MHDLGTAPLRIQLAIRDGARRSCVRPIGFVPFAQSRKGSLDRPQGALAYLNFGIGGSLFFQAVAFGGYDELSGPTAVSCYRLG